jgi:hypothetical protein
MREVSGLYHLRGWRVEVGDDAEADEVLVASMHEAMHDRLQMTTLFGCFVALLQESSTRTGDGACLTRAAGLQRASSRVHEEFATWMSAVPFGWGAERLERAFPVYARHLVRAERRVAELRGPYLRMHAVQAAARASMQPLQLAELLEGGTLAADPSLIGHASRPDARLLRLDRALAEHGWGPVAAWEGDADDLGPQRFDDAADPGWAELNEAAYSWCRALLDAEGCPTLPYDGHLPAVAALRESLGIGPDAAATPSSLVALMSVESETLVLEDPIPAVVLPAGTPPDDLAAGGPDGRHLFLAIRPRRHVLAQYELDGALGAAEHLAVLRCQREDGTVELLDVTDASPEAIAAAAPVVVSIAMSSLADDTVRAHWQPLLGRHQATVLCDLRPSANIGGWLADAALALRYGVVGIESRVGTVRLLVFRVEDASESSRIYLAPVSRLYSTGLELWLGETAAIAGRVRRDDALGSLPLVHYAAAHILLEERLFNFTSGDRDGIDDRAG